ncbi:hypothetical protein [Collimonas silvisoli]|uniref:hypothetical protein n=1 Tax=Collimonas silvisoli TaxID=2825884 RepID=UPI001B8C3754|nr:hypothetical protein [Collimonas silvisoli]
MTNTISNDFGPRTAYTQADMSDGAFAQVAQSDGFVMVNVGQATVASAYLGILEGSTVDGGGNVTSYIYTTGSTQQCTTSSGKKGTQTYYIPLPGTFTMPVRAGETWKLQLTTDTAVAPAPEVAFFWLPDDGRTEIRPAVYPKAGGMRAAMQTLREDIQSGRLQSGLLASAQQAIDERVNDFSQIFGDATKMSQSEQDRQRFVAALQKIVCSATPAGKTPDNRVDDSDIAGLIATMGQVTGRSFSDAQKGMLEAGVRALVQINDNDANRNNLVIINNNIGLFLDNVQQALNVEFGANERRLLTRAVVRLVGDGTQG